MKLAGMRLKTHNNPPGKKDILRGSTEKMVSGRDL